MIKYLKVAGIRCQLLCCFLSALTILLIFTALDAQPAPPPVVPIAIYTPDSSVKFALADLMTIPIEERQYIRYLSLYNIPKERRRAVGQTVSFMVNSLGTRRRMYIPVFVGNSDETVIRLNINDYEWKSDAWETLAQKGSGPRATPEPYFHDFTENEHKEKIKQKKIKKVQKERRVFLGYDRFGQPVYRIEPFFVEEEVTEEVDGVTTKTYDYVQAPWLDPISIVQLAKETNSTAPIIRADWFLVNVSVPPAYYNFLKLGKKFKDFENLIFADEAKAKAARKQDKAVAVVSQVTRNNRILLRSPSITGYSWGSRDSLRSDDKRQYIRNFLDEQFDATEDIGTLANGLQAYFLTDGKGDRLDFANPDIAIDNASKDRLVRPGRSCIICHAEGIKPIDDEVRSLTKMLRDKEQVRLLVPRKEDAYRIDDLFSSDLDKQIVKDQNLYADAIASVNGLSPAVNARQYSEIYDLYAETTLTKDVVARELGLSVADLDKYVRLSADPVVLGLVKDPIRPIRRDHWEESFRYVMRAVELGRRGLLP